MNRVRLILTVCALAGLGGAPALAQSAAPVAVARGVVQPLTAAQRGAAIAEAIEAVRARYVFPDRVPAIVAALEAGLASGRYAVADPGQFAQAVSEDLRSASGDGHMYLRWSPTEYAALTVGDGGSHNAAMDDLTARVAERDNHGLVDQRILPGNVRYLRISGFHWVRDRTGAAYDDALRFLRGGDALIIDLRGNGGGDHAAVRYLLSHFMDPDQLDITFLEAGKEPVQSRTLDHLPAGRLKGRPLYVLINPQVGSAGEAFAYSVQQFHLGTLVGATTAGAANNNDFVAIAPAFALSVSYGRPVHPVTGTNWEGVGVQPDVAVDPSQALDTAHTLALGALLARSDADPAARADWEWARVAMEARLHRVTLPADQLQALAGTYGGRTILHQDGGLVWRRSNGQLARLSPLTADGLFTVEGSDDRLRIRLTGEALEMQRIDSPAPARFPRD